MAEATLEVPTSSGTELDDQLYRHVKRPEWGVAMIAYERSETRAYQFEDGKLRKFPEAFYKLLVPADDLGERTEHIRDNLRRVIEAGDGDSSRKVLEAVAPFSEQVELFIRLYPKGFQDPEWIEDHRNTDGASLKRHREPVIAEAKEALSADRMKEEISEGAFEDLADGIADLLQRTDLVQVSHAKAVRGLEPEEKKRYVEALNELLHGERRYEERFKEWIDVLEALFDERPNWRIATVIPGIMFPETHTVVRRSAFARQAGSIAPTARYSRRAKVRAYRNFRRVALSTRDRLKAAGHEPRDLLDVYDFVWTTLRTSALEHLGSEKP